MENFIKKTSKTNKTKTTTLPIYYSEEYRNSLGRLLELSPEQMKKLKNRLKREIESYEQDTADMQEQLRRWNDLVENVIEETTYPFEGASNLHIPIIAIYMKVYHAVLVRSTISKDKIWYAETDNDRIRDYLADIENNINYKASAKWNIVDALSEVFWTTPRDGLGVMQIPYVEEFENNVHDTVVVTSEADFMEEFPPEDPTMSPSEWQEWLYHVREQASEDDPVEIPIVYDKEIYKGPKGEVVDLADFVIFPATAKDIGPTYARGYGKRFYARRGEIKKKIRDGIWYQKQGDAFLEKTKRGSEVSSYIRSRDDIEGLQRSSHSDDYELFELVYRIELEDGEGERKLLVTYSKQNNIILSIINYPYRVDFYVLFRLQKKPNRLRGGSVPGDLEDINEETDAIHNQRINSRKIAEVPSFKAKRSIQKDFDPEADQNRWKPGVIFWLDDPDSFVQFTVQPVDFNSSIAEEANLIKIASLQMGLDPGIFSGGAQLDNPSAGKDKVNTLIQSSGLRMDDPLTELRKGIEGVGTVCMSHEYQFGQASISYMQSSETGQSLSKSFPKRIMRTGVSLKLYSANVTLSPEIEFQKWAQYYAFFSRDPLIAQRTKSRWELLMRCLRATREKGVSNILPTLEEMQQEEIAMKAQVEMQTQQMAQAQQVKSAIQQKLQQQKMMRDGQKNQLTDMSNIVKKRELMKRLIASAQSVPDNSNGS